MSQHFPIGQALCVYFEELLRKRWPWPVYLTGYSADVYWIKAFHTNITILVVACGNTHVSVYHLTPAGKQSNVCNAICCESEAAFNTDLLRIENLVARKMRMWERHSHHNSAVF